MNANGALRDRFERNYASQDKLKIGSVVSYGVRPLVKLHGNDTLFAAWSLRGKQKLQSDPTDDLAEQYVRYAAKTISRFFSEFTKQFPAERLTSSRKIEDRVLSTVVVNGVLHCMRNIVEADPNFDFDNVTNKFKGVETFKFNGYKSSAYGDLGRALYNKYFK